jgi:hypothetical protein
MSRKAGLTFGTILAALCLVATGVGIALVVMAHGMPSHTDERRAAELTRLYEQNYVKVAPEQREPTKQEIIALRTSKWKLYNAGLGMCLIPPLLLFAMLRFELWDIRKLRTAKTPRTRLEFLGLASCAWLALLPALELQSDDEYGQDDLTPTIDTGHGSLWIVGTKLFLLTLIVMLVFGRFLVLRRVVLPANLWCWDSARPHRSLVLTVLYGLLGCVLVVLIVWSASNFPWAVPSLMVGLYVILSSRAALINVVRQA